MNMNDQIIKLVSDTTLNVNSKYPNTITDEQRSIILNHYLTSNKPINVIQEELNNYSNELIEKINSKSSNTFSFNEIKDAYNNISNSYDLYLSSDITPYLIAGLENNKSYESLDLLIDLKDINEFRNKMKETPYYIEDKDTINYVKDGNDYGLQLNINNVITNIYPFIKDKDSITVYKSMNDKFIVEDIKDNDYLKTYNVGENKINSVSLEYIKREKDKMNDSEVSSLIDRIGYSYDDYNKIVDAKIIKEVSRENINNVSSNELVKNSLINFAYDVKMNENKDLPEDKIDETVERLYNKPYDTIKSYLARAKDALNNKIELPKVLYDQQIENKTYEKSLGFTITRHLAYSIIFVGVIIIIFALVIKVI